MNDSVSRDILLVARDWQSRALTLAQLKEQGYQVTAVPGVRFALELLQGRRIEPPLAIVDVHDDPDATPNAVERLIELAAGAPTVLVVGTHQRAEWERVGRLAAAWLHRPLSIGDLVRVIERHIPPLEGRG